MKSLEQINTEINIKLLALREKFQADPLLSHFSQADYTIWEDTQRLRQYADTTAKFYDIISLLNEYLKMPSLNGDPKRQEIRKQMLEMINKI